MKIIFIFIAVLLQLNTALCQNISIYGKVTDAGSSSPVSLVTVNTDIKTFSISDINGNFQISVTPGIHQITFSRIGYETITKSVKVKKRNNALDIVLQKKTFMLNEVMVTGRVSALQIIQKVKSELKNSLHIGLYTCKGFERTERIKNGKYVFFAEAFIDHINGGYAPIGHAYPFTKALEYRISNTDYSYSTLLAAQPIFPISVNYPTYCYDYQLLPVLLNQTFDFYCSDTILSGEKKIIVINYKFNQQKYKKHKAGMKISKYDFIINRYRYGKILIDMSDYSINEITNKKDNNTISTAKFATSFGSKFLSMRDIISTYKEPSINNFNDTDIIVSHTYIRFNSFDTATISDNEIKKRFKCEVRIDNRFKTHSRWFVDIANKEYKKSQYNPGFWKSIPEPPNWNKICVDLKNEYKIPIDDQFKQNGQCLFSESEYYKAVKKIPNKDMRKRGKCYYIDFKKGGFFK